MTTAYPRSSRSLKVTSLARRVNFFLLTPPQQTRARVVYTNDELYHSQGRSYITPYTYAKASRPRSRRGGKRAGCLSQETVLKNIDKHRHEVTYTCIQCANKGVETKARHARRNNSSYMLKEKRRAQQLHAIRH